MKYLIRRWVRKQVATYHLKRIKNHSKECERKTDIFMVWMRLARDPAVRR